MSNVPGTSEGNTSNFAPHMEFSIYTLQEAELLEVVRQKCVREASIGIPLDDRGYENDEEQTNIVLQRNNFKSSTKLNALLQNLRVFDTI